MRGHFRKAVLLAAVLTAACAQTERPSTTGRPPTPWVSHAIPEAKGEVKILPDGKKVHVRYKGWTTEDFSQFRTYAYDDMRPAPPVSKAPMPPVTGDPKAGRKLFLARAKGPCTGCHLIPGDDVWPAGNVGPDLSTYGDRKLPDEYVFTQVYDSRKFFPNTTMPPWGTAGILTPEEIVHIVAFLQTLKGPVAPEKDPNRNPDTRAKPVGFGDNLDPTNNPAVVLAEGAMSLWSKKGPTGKACADCHGGGPEKSMKGVATRYPRYVTAFQRVMSIEDFLTVHAPATTGLGMLAQSDDNLHMTVLIKMQSNGMPVSVDVSSPEARAAFERGRASYFKKVGQRSHACADCHTKGAGQGAEKFLGGRLLGDAETGFTKHFPLWRTSQAAVWDMRRRMQWCMTPLGMNMLPADAVEYAELELFLTAFDNGQPMSVPGIRH
ncbi:MAG: sulfur oxidation c-type cytochrome SoxA [Candidatus Rokubacteria bacterium]|nr:sulfur oxidation c-type cytochrome SoxA [Candidatus Rokubacteria bacterium]